MVFPVLQSLPSSIKQKMNDLELESQSLELTNFEKLLVGQTAQKDQQNRWMDDPQWWLGTEQWLARGWKAGEQ